MTILHKACSAAACAMALGAASGQVTGFQHILFRDDPMPMFGPGVYFDVSSTPTINNAGQLALTVGLRGPGVNQTTNKTAVMVGTPGNLGVYLRQGDPFPAIPGLTTSEPSAATPAFNSAGQVAMVSRLSGAGVTSANDRAITSGTPAAYDLVARTGTFPPGSSLPYLTFDYGASLNDLGQTAFMSDLNTAKDRHAIWMAQGSSGALIALTGGPAPGGGTFTGKMSRPVLSDTGRVGFVAAVNTLGFRGAIFAGTPGAIDRIVAYGDAVPGVPGATFSTIASGPAMSRAGEVAFPAEYLQGSTTASGIFRSGATPSAGLAPVVLSSQTLPGALAGSTTRFFYNVAMRSPDSIVFHAELKTGGGVTLENNNGLWASRAGVIEAIALEGAPAPGLGPGVNLGFTNTTSFSVPNAHDMIATQLELSGPNVTSDSDRALFIWDPLGGLRSVVREGQAFEVAPGDFRTIQYIEVAAGSKSFVGTGNYESGIGSSSSCLNDAGTLVFSLRFTDSTEGVFSVLVPSPSAGIPLAVLLLRRRPRR